MDVPESLKMLAVTPDGDDDILSLAQVRSDVNVFLKEHLVRQTHRAAAIHNDYQFLWESTSAQFESGGKRFRPYLCVLIYQILGGSNYKNILPLASSLELLHVAMLMHDDVIDRDYIRHGQPNLTGIYKTHYAAFTNDEYEATHFAAGASILAGDLLISEAYQLIIQSKVSAETRIRVCQLLGEAIYNLSAGELLDIEAVFYPPEYVDSFKIAELKTAFYTCTTPLVIGGMLANADPAVIVLLRKIGSALGIAFQMADDLLGVFGSEKSSGKTNLSDLREGKRTYLLQRTLQLANESQKLVLQTILGNRECNDAMVEQARRIMIDCGARAEVVGLMAQYVDQANDCVTRLPVENIYKTKLREFIDQAVWRSC